MTLFFFSFVVIISTAQNQYTPYDELPGIDKIYKPAYDKSFSGWKKMLYEYPINFIDIENDFNSYIIKNRGKKSAIIRYYKIWRKIIKTYSNSKGNIELPDIQKIRKEIYNAQLNAGKLVKSATIIRSNWTFLGPKETFWLNSKNSESDPFDQKQCPWQVNVYSFDVADSNEDILFCGTETKIVNKSIDKGLNWSQVGKNYLFSGAVSAVAIDSKNADIVYVSAGKQIHKTTNGGETWTPLLDLNGQFSSMRLRIDKTNTDIIIAASDNGFYISKNAGNTWNRRWTKPVWDIEFKPGDSSVIYGITKNSSGKFQIIISTDGGNSFNIDSNFPTTYTETSGGLLAVTPANPNVLYATMLAKENGDGVPFIMKGVASGGNFSWNETKKGKLGGGLGDFSNGQGYFDLVLEVSLTNENVVFWGTCVFWKSTDGGQNFSRIGGYGGIFPIHPDMQDIKITASGDTWVSTDGGMNYSTDFFALIENYSSRTKGIVGSGMWGFDQGWNEDITVGGRYHNGNTAIADFYGDKALRMGGAEAATGWVLKGKSRHVAYSDLGNGWILPKSVDGIVQGRFAFSKHPNMDEYGGRRSNVVQHPNYYNTIYIGFEDGIWISNDFGASFDMLFKFPGRVRFFQISHKNPNVLYADIVGSGLYRSEDGGKSWTLKPTLTDGRYGDSGWRGKLSFVISPYNENKIYVTLQAGTWSQYIGKVFWSGDGGSTWHDWTDGLNEYTKCLAIQPSIYEKDIVYLFTVPKNGQTAKVYSRFEQQPSWSNFDNNYPAQFSAIHALPFYRDAKLRVAGNAGILESPLTDTLFTPIVNQMIAKQYYDCMEDTLYFEDHSMVRHKDASWKWQITPEPTFINDTNIRNPKVVLGNPGDYDVTLSITQNGETYSKTISKMVSTTTCPSINDCSNPGTLNQEIWELIGTDSEETNGEDGKAINAFDGDPTTIWHTAWYYQSPDYPHEIKIDLGGEFAISGFNYLPRQNSANGRIKEYEFYISNDKTNWGTPVDEGTFESGSSIKRIRFSATSGKYIKLKSLSEQNGNNWASISEFNLLGCIGTKSNEFEINNISAYPIPATDRITINLPQFNSSKNWSFKIISSTGQIVQTNEFSSYNLEYTFKLNNIKSGLYFIKLRSEDATIYRIKFIKN